MNKNVKKIDIFWVDFRVKCLGFLCDFVDFWVNFVDFSLSNILLRGSQGLSVWRAANKRLGGQRAP